MDNQDNFKDNQTYEVDIELIYNDFIKQIDEIRGYVNISSANNLKFLNKISEDNFAGVSGKLSVEKTFQESRIHAFYRLIGFPVLSNNDQYYSPGHDSIKYPLSFLTRKQNNKYKIDVINNIKSGFYEFSNKREQYYNTTVKSWCNYQDINTVTYLLSSYNIRNFNDHFENYSGTYDFDINNQSYLVKLSDPLNRSLLEYSYSNGADFIQPTKLSSKRNHIIFPFLVDPRIDLSASKKVCVPFPLSKKHVNVSETYQAPRCLLEGIITERFKDNNFYSSESTFTDTLKQVIQSFSLTQDKELIDNLIEVKGKYTTTDSKNFQKFLNIIASMIDELVNAQKDIGYVVSNTYWLPICGLSGPEGIISSFSIPLLTEPKFKTSLDDQISLFQRKDILNSIIPQSDKVEDNEFSFSGLFSSIIDLAANSFGNLVKQSASDLIKQKNYFDNKGAESLRKIEIIMGEFSGLGLCDIIAIIGGLYLVDRKYLLGLIDEDSYTRAVKKLSIYGFDQPSIEESMIELNKVVFGFYNIMQKIYTDKIKFGL